MRLPKTFIPALLITVWSMAAGAEPRMISVVVSEDDAWHVTVSDAADATFSVDSIALEARVLAEHGNEVTWELSRPTVEPQRLILGDGRRDVLAVRVGSHTETAAPFNDWVIYHIMAAYFRNGSRANDKAGFRHWIHKNYAGGDLQGVLQKADYLAELGVNAVWLSPIFASETSHGYDVTNYFAIAEAMAFPRDREGSLTLYHNLVDALHERNIRVVLDLPLDYGSGAYDRRAGDPNRRRPKATGPIQEAEKMWESWGTDFQYWRFSHESTRRFLREVAIHWLVEGRADGLRLDYVRGVPRDFWAELYSSVKAVRPDAFLFGEAWQDGYLQGPNAVDIATYYQPVPGIGPQFDGLLDFPMKITMADVFARGGKAVELERWLQRTAGLYGPDGRPVYFLDNHDMARFLAWAGDRGADKLVAALGFMASLSSPMVIFYGTETGIRGGSARRGFTDNGREPMPWDRLDSELIARVSEVLALRRDHPALARGGRLPLFADDEVLVMLKTHAAGNLLIGVNVSQSARTVSLTDLGLDRDAAGFRLLLGPDAPTLNGTGTLEWTLAPHTTSIAAPARGRTTASP